MKGMVKIKYEKLNYSNDKLNEQRETLHLIYRAVCEIKIDNGALEIVIVE